MAPSPSAQGTGLQLPVGVPPCTAGASGELVEAVDLELLSRRSQLHEQLQACMGFRQVELLVGKEQQRDYDEV